MREDMQLKITTTKGNIFISDFPVTEGKTISEIQEAISEIFNIKTTYFTTLDNRHVVISTSNIESIEIINPAAV